jgi:hypothetical protein
MRPISRLIPKDIRKLIIKYILNRLLNTQDFLSASYGEINQDKVILIIGGHNAGLYSIIHNVVGYLIYAKQKGYIPVIDYKNNKTFYHDKSYDGNLWEEYFLQPSYVSLDDAYLSKNVLHTPLSFSHEYYPSSGLHVLENKKKTMEIHEIFKDNIKYNKNTADYIEEAYRDITGKNLLGIYLRGTDYNYAKGHAIQPNLQMIYEKIDYFFSKYKEIEGLYVSTEEEETLDNLIEKYGDLVYYQIRPRVINFQEGQITPSFSFDGVSSKIKIGKEYLADIEVLSRLKFFLSGLSNGSAAVVEKNGFIFEEYYIIFDGFRE